MKKLIGQQMMIGIQGTSLTEDEKKFLTENDIAGVTLFGRNVESPEQIHALVSELQGLRNQKSDHSPFFVAIDMEGGRVARLKAPFTQWPTAEKMSALDSTSVAFKFANMMGSELTAMGINLNFSPCIDVLTNPENEIIGDRALGKEPEIVAKLGSALVRGFIKSGIIPCAKHFPGHGGVKPDSHIELPEDDTDLDTLKNIHMSPFKKVFRARLPMVMTAHIRYKNLDPEWPATLSESIIRDYIRGEFKFRNLVISDDLDMKALRNHWEVGEIAVRAIQAGCNILLYCNEFDSPQIAIDAIEKAVSDGAISKGTLEENAKLVAEIKENFIQQIDPVPFDQAAKLVGHANHKRLSQSIIEGDVPEDLLAT